MGRSLGRFKISGVLITICMGPFQKCIQKIVDLGQEVFVSRGTFNLMEARSDYIHVCIILP